MKKVYLLFLLATFGYLTVGAQLAPVKSEKNKTKINPALLSRHQPHSNLNRKNGLALWSDDFSIPANWIIDHAPNASSDNWVIGTNPPSGPAPIDTINSASAANNFAMFDSDLLCSHDQIANLTTANPIDLS